MGAVPLQNRCDPFGELHAVPARGTMMGNRGGRFHRPDRTLGRRRWASQHWICCVLDWKGWHHEPMGEGYTSVFFLDEVTALAGGHRPCFFCRRRDARRFVDLSAADSAPALDRLAHAERRGPRPRLSATAAERLPDGAMVALDGRPWARSGGAWLPWDFSGYGAASSDLTASTGPGAGEAGEAGVIELLTPPAYLAVLTAGFEPQWHPTAAR